MTIETTEIVNRIVVTGEETITIVADGFTQSGGGSGTVTSVSVTTANGISGTVATATTTPAITLSLGAITPSTVRGLTITTTTGTFTLTNSKTFSVSNTLTLAGTDGSTLNIGTGGTLGTLAYQSGTFSGTSSGTNTGDQTSIVGITGTFAEFNTAVTDANLARTSGTNTFTGDQTFSGNIIGAGGAIELGNGTGISGFVIIYNGTGASAYHVITSNATDTRSNYLPDADGDFVLDTATQTLTNKTISGANNTITGLKQIVTVVFDGGGSAPTANTKRYIRVPYAATITKWTILGDVSGSAVVDVWKDTYVNYPPTVADSIAASAKPTLSSALKNENSTLTGWTTTITAGDVLGFNLDSCTTCTVVAVELEITTT
jgi:hypothetical protein